MQNMIQLAKGKHKFDVFFDMNRDTQDFENVKVKFQGKIVPVPDTEMEELKDTIALEWNLSVIELAKIYQSGQTPVVA
jgi:hypothetical protein